MRGAIAKVLKWFALGWLYLVAGVIVIAVAADFWFYGFFKTLDLISPANWRNCLVVMVLISPGVGAHMLSEKLSKGQQEKSGQPV
jgi:uncharacterized membrane protein